jgi:hypothetical protein
MRPVRTSVQSPVTDHIVTVTTVTPDRAIPVEVVRQNAPQRAVQWRARVYKLLIGPRLVIGPVACACIVHPA